METKEKQKGCRCELVVSRRTKNNERVFIVSAFSDALSASPSAIAHRSVTSSLIAEFHNIYPHAQLLICHF